MFNPILSEPLDNPKVTQWFGNKLYLERNGKKIDFYGQWGMKGHNGIDYGCPIGTPVFAMASGQILEAGYNQGYGNYVRQYIVGLGEIVYGHFNELCVKKGDYVEVGMKIALSGNSGASTGPHLHVGYRPMGHNVNNGYKGYIDHEKYLISKKTYMNLLDEVQRLVNVVAGLEKKVSNLESNQGTEKKDRRKNDKKLKEKKANKGWVKKQLNKFKK